jgi:hypothetical protein
MIRMITTPIHMIPSVEPGTEPGVGTGVGVSGLSREAGAISGEPRRAKPESEFRKVRMPTAVKMSTG